MRRTSLFAGALLLGMPLGGLSAQERWNDRASDAWLKDAPRVRVWIDGPRSVQTGAPVRVQFDVSDDAYVVVGRVSSDGRLTVLYPRNSNQRPLVGGGGMIHTVLHPRTGAPFGFVVNEQFSGYVFALASYAPLDLSVLETRVFQETMGYGRFALANREFARSPDEYVPRFASMLLWGDDVSYDYDVDYYYPYTAHRYASASSFCFSGYNGFDLFDRAYGVGLSRALLFGFDDWAYGGYRSLCNNNLFLLRCLTYASFYTYGCPILPSRIPPRYASRPDVPLPGADSSARPNGKLILGGLWRPDTVGRVAKGDKQSATDPGTRRASEWEGVYSIPTRAITKLKRQEAGEEAAPVTAAGDLSRFRTVGNDATAPRRAKPTAADRGDRAEPARPTRERAESPSRTRERSTGASSGRSRPGYDAVMPGRQRGASKPASAQPPKQSKPATTKSKPASSSGDKTKPPPAQK